MIFLQGEGLNLKLRHWNERDFLSIFWHKDALYKQVSKEDAVGKSFYYIATTRQQQKRMKWKHTSEYQTHLQKPETIKKRLTIHKRNHKIHVKTQLEKSLRNYTNS